MLYHWATTACQISWQLTVVSWQITKPINSHLSLVISTLSGRRGSNPRPTAWKAVALPTELLPQSNLKIWRFENLKINSQNNFHLYHLKNFCSNATQFSNLQILKLVTVGKGGFEPPNSEEDRFTVCCRWPLGYLPNLSHLSESNQRPTDYKSVALPAELKWHFYFQYPFLFTTRMLCQLKLFLATDDFSIPAKNVQNTHYHYFFEECKGKRIC